MVLDILHLQRLVSLQINLSPRCQYLHLQELLQETQGVK